MGRTPRTALPRGQVYWLDQPIEELWCHLGRSEGAVLEFVDRSVRTPTKLTPSSQVRRGCEDAYGPGPRYELTSPTNTVDLTPVLGPLCNRCVDAKSSRERISPFGLKRIQGRAFPEDLSCAAENESPVDEWCAARATQEKCPCCVCDSYLRNAEQRIGCRTYSTDAVYSLLDRSPDKVIGYG